MGFRFRRSIRLVPGIRVNIGKKGANSVSLGGRGVTLNVGKKGVRSTVGIPGTGLSYTSQLPTSPMNSNSSQPQNVNRSKGLPSVIVTLAICGLFLLVLALLGAFL